LTWAKKQTCNNWHSNIDSTDSDNNNNLFIDADNEELYHSININDHNFLQQNILYYIAGLL